MGEKRFRSIFIWSIILLICACIIPSYHWMGGLFPEWDLKGRLDSWALISLVLNIFEEDHVSSDAWPVFILLAESIPVVFTLIGSRNKKRKMCITSSIIAIISMVIVLLGFMMETADAFSKKTALNFVFDTSECAISIGFWIVLAIHIICLGIAIRINKDNAQEKDESNHMEAR